MSAEAHQTQAASVPGDQPRDVVRVGLIGAGIAASRTPRMHMEEGRALGLDYRYELIDTDTLPDSPSIKALLDDAQARGLAGVNVTFPFKRQALAHVDRIDASAAAVGATNTIVFGDQGRTAYNTDYAGFQRAFLAGIGTLPFGAVLLIGAGGAGGAVANALLDAGTQILFVHDTDTTSAEALVDSLNARLGAGRARVAGDLRVACAAADGLVNATPVGMAKLPGTPVDMTLVEPRHWVADIVYFPLETAFLAGARAKGCPTIDGSGMAVFQAVVAFEHFTGLTPDPQRMRTTFDSFT